MTGTGDKHPTPPDTAKEHRPTLEAVPAESDLRLVGVGSGSVRICVAVVDDEGTEQLLAVRSSGAGQVTHEGHDFRVDLAVSDDAPTARLDLRIHHVGTDARPAGVRVSARLPGTMTRPHWMIPGAFYRENRPAGDLGTFPRAVLAPGDPDGASRDGPFTSTWWSMRSDRAAAPAVLGWTDQSCVGLAVEPVTSLGMSGLGFDAGPPPRTWVDLPWREGPVVYDGSEVAKPAEAATHEWASGEVHEVSIWVVRAAPEPHAYGPFLRHMYDRHRRSHELRPWVTPDRAARLTAHALQRWHHRTGDQVGGDPGDDVLVETVGFDRGAPDVDRHAMHVAWVSGIPWAHAMVRESVRTGDRAMGDAGARIIDTICRNRTPSGAFWGQWTPSGWNGGWNRDRDVLHARTLAEATLFTIRTLQLDGAPSSPSWRRAVEGNLAVCRAAMDEDGNLGSYYHQATGEVVDRRGAAGILWIAALADGAALLEQPDLLDTATRAATHYARFVDDAFVHGAPEDVHLAPTSEDAYNAVIAFVRLHQATGGQRWLDTACRAAEWMMTFRWTHNVTFHPDTILGTYAFASRGADQASPANQHLHAYGLVALEEMLTLWRATGDDHWLDRSRDNLACFLQFIARRDGDFNARRGMVTERYYQTNCFQPKGSLLTLSHAWCLGVTLLGAQVALADPEAFPTDGSWTTQREETTAP